MTSTNWDVAQDIGVINHDIRFNIVCVFYFATADGQESASIAFLSNNILISKHTKKTKYKAHLWQFYRKSWYILYNECYKHSQKINYKQPQWDRLWIIYKEVYDKSLQILCKFCLQQEQQIISRECYCASLQALR